MDYNQISGLVRGDRERGTDSEALWGSLQVGAEGDEAARSWLVQQGLGACEGQVRVDQRCVREVVTRGMWQGGKWKDVETPPMLQIQGRGLAEALLSPMAGNAGERRSNVRT